jgi:hypothetical protein
MLGFKPCRHRFFSEQQIATARFIVKDTKLCCSSVIQKIKIQRPLSQALQPTSSLLHCLYQKDERADPENREYKESLSLSLSPRMRTHSEVPLTSA